MDLGRHVNGKILSLERKIGREHFNNLSYTLGAHDGEVGILKCRLTGKREHGHFQADSFRSL